LVLRTLWAMYLEARYTVPGMYHQRLKYAQKLPHDATKYDATRAEGEERVRCPPPTMVTTAERKTWPGGSSDVPLQIQVGIHLSLHDIGCDTVL